MKVSPKLLFAHVNRNRKLAHPPISLSLPNGLVSSSPPEVCEIFRSSFASIFRPDLGAPIPPLPAPQKIMADPVFTEDEVREALMKLNCNKGPGPDGLFPRLLREMSPFIATPHAAFFNASLRSGLVPKQ